MATQVNPPRGMRDFLPAEKARREGILSVIRDSYRAHGFDEIETPVVEDSARLHSGLGGDNEKLAFAVMKRGITVDDLREASDPLVLADLGLRFDLTVPLARFYASHRPELPTVFRAIQIAPVWRAERPQKGRYRQFVQCDIDIIGEAGPMAEIELITATVATLQALGLTGFTVRVNDRRILLSALASLGFDPADNDSVLITVDKLDKVGVDGVIAELRSKGITEAAVSQLENLLRRPAERLPFGEAGIRAVTPDGVDTAAVESLVAIGDAVAGVIGEGVIEFDPWLVRGMGYYTGTIFEIAHPDLGYSLGGGGRYDGMIGRFLGTDVPAAGFSLGFERFVDLVDLPAGSRADAVALLYEADASPAHLAALQSALVAQGLRVRLERKPRNVAPLLAGLAASGFSRIATVRADSTPDSLEFRPLE
ncbi:histidyl-tRNA synthetase [Microbacteriaceae bacterium SG_E_30_P1]|uniref:Histidine--tRNA ligase n=1 Tax=Antiquaquibacter oligotrophicus TaxID=2880260 RepID=A0ABT6KMA6_9MICO|nr:histidine--tRNA ligase [Antiquaquibacter oligotrophicus]MDH6180309.1 histidyl-tRNA synthetase [Antiquaquibacter oligotrophicus]UDF13944.1 histidine--tRNA ligase [Antiquaquibacter oligotrophicus]